MKTLLKIIIVSLLLSLSVTGAGWLIINFTESPIEKESKIVGKILYDMTVGNCISQTSKPVDLLITFKSNRTEFDYNKQYAEILQNQIRQTLIMESLKKDATEKFEKEYNKCVEKYGVDHAESIREKRSKLTSELRKLIDQLINYERAKILAQSAGKIPSIYIPGKKVETKKDDETTILLKKRIKEISEKLKSVKFN